MERTDDILKRAASFSMACFAAGMLASCAYLKEEPPPPPPEPPPEPEAAPEIPEPVLPCSTLPTRDLERQALELLDAGKIPTARETLNCALELNPAARQAGFLLEQLDADPVEYLGGPYFWHTVESSETLSKIAQRYLGSSLKFVILARYNGIDVPANLVVGQDIKVPGKRPIPEAPPKKPDVPQGAPELQKMALEMEQQGNLDEAFKLMTQALASDPNLDGAQEALKRVKKRLILKLDEDAYNRELSGDLEKAAEIWRRILAIDPGNISAQLALKRLTE